MQLGRTLSAVAVSAALSVGTASFASAQTTQQDQPPVDTLRQDTLQPPTQPTPTQDQVQVPPTQPTTQGQVPMPPTQPTTQGQVPMPPAQPTTQGQVQVPPQQNNLQQGQQGTVYTNQDAQQQAPPAGVQPTTTTQSGTWNETRAQESDRRSMRVRKDP